MSFDFGKSGAVASGKTKVETTSSYSSSAGFGWTSGRIYAGGATTDPTKDFAYMSDGTFRVDLADGTYDVSLTMGDPIYIRESMGVYLQGKQVDTVSTAANQFVTRTYRVSVTGGYLTLELKDLGGDPYAVINALTIKSV
jgi:fibronectin type 3 domain-containing protein